MQVMDNVSWAFHCAHTTAQTYGFFDHSTAVFYFYRTGCTGLLADSTADTADVTLFLCFCAFFLIGAFYYTFCGQTFAQAPQPMHFSSSTSATPYSLMEMAPNLHLSIQALHPIHPSAQPASPSADLHPPLHATTAARYGNFFFTAIFSTSFHMVFRSEEDYIVFHHSI